MDRDRSSQDLGAVTAERQPLHESPAAIRATRGHQADHFPAVQRRASDHRPSAIKASAPMTTAASPRMTDRASGR